VADRIVPASDAVLTFSKGNADYADDYRSMGWKGFEEAHPSDVAADRKAFTSEDDLDMTPMVDVTFLLLIFFMVTASFSLQRSIPLPGADSEQPGPIAPVDPLITVTIDQHNTFHVASSELGEFECPSEREMRQRLRDSVEEADASKLVILAHVDSYHGKLVAAWDGGVIAGVEDIVIQTTEDEF